MYLMPCFLSKLIAVFLQDLWERRSRGRLNYNESPGSLPGVDLGGRPDGSTRSLFPLLPGVHSGCPCAVAILSSVIPASMPVKKNVPYVCSYENDVLIVWP